MINPVESGLDLFSAIVRDMFKTVYNYGIFKKYNVLQQSGKNYNNMRTHNIILQGHEQKEKPLTTISCHLDWTSSVNNGFINYMTKNKCFLAGPSRQDELIVPEQPIKTKSSLYLASLQIHPYNKNRYCILLSRMYVPLTIVFQVIEGYIPL